MNAGSRLVAAAAGGILLSGLAACGGIEPEPFVVDPTRSASESEQREEPMRASDLQDAFAEFQSRHPGAVTVAWAKVNDPDSVQTLGTPKDLDAWSTFKVPVSVAAVKADPSSDRISDLVRQAITESDNVAAARLWRSLGASDAAADATDVVLRAGGDTTTRAGRDDEGQRHGFGRTEWTVQDAARYASTLPCTADAAPVYEEMGRIVDDHRWGIGSVGKPVHFKGGWGPSDHGYLVRQIGVVDLHEGAVALALVVQPKDGSHETGTRTASEVASWLVSRLGKADAGTCPGGLPTPPPVWTPTPTATSTDVPSSSGTTSTGSPAQTSTGSGGAPSDTPDAAESTSS